MYPSGIDWDQFRQYIREGAPWLLCEGIDIRAMTREDAPVRKKDFAWQSSTRLGDLTPPRLPYVPIRWEKSSSPEDGDEESNEESNEESDEESDEEKPPFDGEVNELVDQGENSGAEDAVEDRMENPGAEDAKDQVEKSEAEGAEEDQMEKLEAEGAHGEENDGEHRGDEIEVDLEPISRAASPDVNLQWRSAERDRHLPSSGTGATGASGSNTLPAQPRGKKRRSGKEATRATSGSKRKCCVCTQLLDYLSTTEKQNAGSRTNDGVGSQPGSLKKKKGKKILRATKVTRRPAST